MGQLINERCMYEVCTPGPVRLVEIGQVKDARAHRPEWMTVSYVISYRL
jgi:hypothetical protein